MIASHSRELAIVRDASGASGSTSRTGRRYARTHHRRVRERFQRVPVREPVLDRDQIPRFVNRDSDVIVRPTRSFAEVELDVRAHGLPLTPVPGVAVVPLHRFGRAGAIGREQRLGHRFVFREGPCAGVAIGCERMFERRPSGKAVLAGERVLHVAERRVWIDVG